PGAAKTVYEWFGKKERALANGIAIGGSAIGAVVAPPLTILIAGHYGWRWSFILPGLFGLVWVLVWALTSWKKKEVQPEMVEVSPVKNPGIPFMRIMRNKYAFAFVLIRFLLDP